MSHMFVSVRLNNLNKLFVDLVVIDLVSIQSLVHLLCFQLSNQTF